MSNLVEVGEDRLAARQPGHEPTNRPDGEQRDVAHLSDPPDDQLAQVGHPAGYPIDGQLEGARLLQGALGENVGIGGHGVW